MARTATRHLAADDWRFHRAGIVRDYCAVSDKTNQQLKLGDDLELAWKRFKRLRRGRQLGRTDYVRV